MHGELCLHLNTIKGAHTVTISTKKYAINIQFLSSIFPSARDHLESEENYKEQNVTNLRHNNDCNKLGISSCSLDTMIREEVRDIERLKFLLQEK